MNRLMTWHHARSCRAVLPPVIALYLVLCGGGCSSGMGRDSTDDVDSQPAGECTPVPGDVLGGTVEVMAIPPSGQIYHGAFLGGVTDWGEEDDVTPNDLQSYQQHVGKSLVSCCINTAT